MAFFARALVVVALVWSAFAILSAKAQDTASPEAGAPQNVERQTQVDGKEPGTDANQPIVLKPEPLSDVEKPASVVDIDTARAALWQSYLNGIQDTLGSGEGEANRATVSERQAFTNSLLSIGVAALFIVAFCVMYFVKRADGEFSRHYLVLIVVLTAIFLLVLGYDEQQVAPAFGLLGTILGYIFGRATGTASVALGGEGGGEADGSGPRDQGRSAGNGADGVPSANETEAIRTSAEQQEAALLAAEQQEVARASAVQREAAASAAEQQEIFRIATEQERAAQAAVEQEAARVAAEQQEKAGTAPTWEPSE